MDYMLFLTGYDSTYIEPALSDSCQPVMYTLNIEDNSDLRAKVIKSKTASVEIPELDIRILPGSNTKDLVCDVFGLLSRIEGAIEVGHNVEIAKKDDLIQKITQLKEGRRKATLILIDPSGLSLVMGRASKEILNT